MPAQPRRAKYSGSWFRSLNQWLTLARGFAPVTTGVRQTLADLAVSPTPSMGFMKLIEFKMGDMSAEALILKYKSEFDEETVAAARKRVKEHGVELAADVV